MSTCTCRDSMKFIKSNSFFRLRSFLPFNTPNELVCAASRVRARAHVRIAFRVCHRCACVTGVCPRALARAYASLTPTPSSSDFHHSKQFLIRVSSVSSGSHG